MVRRMDRVTQTLGRSLRKASDDLLDHGMYYPTKWDPFFREHITILELYHYPTQHFEFHKAQLRIER